MLRIWGYQGWMGILPMRRHGGVGLLQAWQWCVKEAFHRERRQNHLYLAFNCWMTIAPTASLSADFLRTQLYRSQLLRVFSRIIVNTSDGGSPFMTAVIRLLGSLDQLEISKGYVSWRSFNPSRILPPMVAAIVPGELGRSGVPGLQDI